MAVHDLAYRAEMNGTGPGEWPLRPQERGRCFEHDPGQVQPRQCGQDNQLYILERIKRHGQGAAQRKPCSDTDFPCLLCHLPMTAPPEVEEVTTEQPYSNRVLEVLAPAAD
ncbi:hypothetical protein VULLAG_LOCUS9154 [Vulpes lagopus]